MTSSKFLKPEIYKEHLIIFTRSGFGVAGQVYNQSLEVIRFHSDISKNDCFKYLINCIEKKDFNTEQSILINDIHILDVETKQEIQDFLSGLSVSWRIV